MDPIDVFMAERYGLAKDAIEYDIIDAIFEMGIAGAPYIIATPLESAIHDGYLSALMFMGIITFVDNNNKRYNATELSMAIGNVLRISRTNQKTKFVENAKSFVRFGGMWADIEGMTNERKEYQLIVMEDMEKIFDETTRLVPGQKTVLASGYLEKILAKSFFDKMIVGDSPFSIDDVYRKQIRYWKTGFRFGVLVYMEAFKFSPSGGLLKDKIEDVITMYFPRPTKPKAVKTKEPQPDLLVFASASTSSSSSITDSSR